jgi:hypothetical protein
MICELTEKGKGPRKGRDREREGTGSRVRKAGTGSRPSIGLASRVRKAASRPSSGSRVRKAATRSRTSTGSASRVRKVASRLSTNGGVEGGGSVEAEHWVKGEEGRVEGGDGVGVEADKRWRHRCKGRD